MRHSAAKPHLLKALLLCLLAVGLVGLVLAKSLAAYLAGVSPEYALRLNLNEPNASLNLADQLLAQLRTQIALPPPGSGPLAEPANNILPAVVDRARVAFLKQNTPSSPLPPAPPIANPEDLEAYLAKTGQNIRGLAEQTLANDPLNAHAMAILAELSQYNRDTERVNIFAIAAMKRSLRESGAVAWLLLKAAEDRDYQQALAFADALLRAKPGTLPLVIPVLAKLAETNGAVDHLKAVLASNPPWRSSFFSMLPSNISDARTPLILLLSLKDTTNPPTIAEQRAYLNFLLEHNLHQIAYSTWLQFLTSEQLSSAGFLNNGDFNSLPSGLAFDWIIEEGSGASVQVVTDRSDSDRHGLSIEFGSGRTIFGIIQQTIFLGPGEYQLNGNFKGVISGRRGLRWRIRCIESQPLLGETPMFLGTTPKWKGFELAFTVPGTGCSAQQVRLVLDARSASEHLVTGTAWYDHMRISRRTGEAPPASPGSPPPL